MVVGEKPPDAISRSQGESLKPPDELVVVSKHFNDAVMRGLAFDGQERPQSIAAFLDLLIDNKDDTDNGNDSPVDSPDKSAKGENVDIKIEISEVLAQEGGKKRIEYGEQWTTTAENASREIRRGPHF